MNTQIEPSIKKNIRARCVSKAISTAAFLLLLHSASALSKENSVETIATELLTDTGVFAHLAAATNAIVAEANKNFLLCEFSDNQFPEVAKRNAYAAMLQRHIGPSVNQDRAVAALVTQLPEEVFTAAREWYGTDSGRRIVAADAESKAFTEEKFESVAAQYIESDAYTEERQGLISQVTDAMRATRFVSLVNGEITVAIKVSSHCDNTIEGFKALSRELKTVRTDVRWFENVLREDLIQVNAVVYRDLSDTDLQNFLEFLQSDHGTAFTSGLLEATRHGISGGLLGIRTERLAKS